MIGELPELPNFLNRANKTHQYQILPDLAPDDYAALKSDIGERGVMVAIEYDQDGNIIDGHHRVRACTELGIREWPRTVRTYSDDAARMRQARKLNVARRHLDNAAKRALIEAELKERPTQSDRAIAKEVGVTHKTIGTARRDLESRGEIPHVETRKDSKGRKQPGKNVRKQPFIVSKLSTLDPCESDSDKTGTKTQISTLKTIWAESNNASLRAAWAASNNEARRVFLEWLKLPVAQVTKVKKI